MHTLGYVLVALAALFSLSEAITGFATLKRYRLLRLLQVVSLAAIGSSLGFLAWRTAMPDGSMAYAALNHAPMDSPLSYRIAAVWSGQSGGLLLWCTEIALVSLAIRPRSQARTIAILAGIQFCLVSLVVYNNPFAETAVGISGGMNPLLTNPMMLIHPPMLFLGYALLAVPYSITLGSLIEGDPNAWRKHVRSWILLAWLALTLGNGFGASWAYRTIGWGGFWSWDPVENTSFVPWILATVAVHGLWLARYSQRWLKISAISALGGFLSVLYGSFLSRSGLLGGSSVHAYVKGESLFVWALGGLLALASICATYLLMLRWRNWQLQSVRHSSDSKPVSLGTAVLIIIGILVLAGMSLPVFNIAPTPTVYNLVLMPFATAVMLALAWHSLRSMQRTVRIAAQMMLTGASLLAVPFSINYSSELGAGFAGLIPAVLAPILLVSCIFVSLEALEHIIWGHKLRTNRGAAMAHLGLALLIAGSVVSGYLANSQQTFLAIGTQMTFGNQRVALIKTDISPNGIRHALLDIEGRSASVEIERNEKFTIPLHKACIFRKIWGDLYITPLAITTEVISDGNVSVPPGALLEITRKPGMTLVWVGIGLLGLGISLSLLRKTNADNAD